MASARRSPSRRRRPRATTGKDEAEALAADLARGPGQAIAVKADVSVAADAARLIDTAVDRFGRLDCLVNNAGIGEVIALEDLDEAAFAKTLHVNLIGAFLASQVAWPHMTGHGGRLVFMSSLAARTSGTLSADYAA